MRNNTVGVDNLYRIIAIQQIDRLFSTAEQIENRESKKSRSVVIAAQNAFVIKNE